MSSSKFSTQSECTVIAVKINTIGWQFSERPISVMARDGWEKVVYEWWRANVNAAILGKTNCWFEINAEGRYDICGQRANERTYKVFCSGPFAPERKVYNFPRCITFRGNLTSSFICTCTILWNCNSNVLSPGLLYIYQFVRRCDRRRPGRGTTSWSSRRHQLQPTRYILTSAPRSDEPAEAKHAVGSRWRDVLR